jgi:hypothetical protein
MPLMRLVASASLWIAVIDPVLLSSIPFHLSGKFGKVLAEKASILGTSPLPLGRSAPMFRLNLFHGFAACPGPTPVPRRLSQKE